MHLRFALLIVALLMSACTVPSSSNPTPTLAPGAEELLGAPTATPAPRDDSTGSHCCANGGARAVCRAL